MQWISSIFWKCWKLCYSISEKCWKFIASKMLQIKSRHLTWCGPIRHFCPKRCFKTLSTKSWFLSTYQDNPSLSWNIWLIIPPPAIIFHTASPHFDWVFLCKDVKIMLISFSPWPLSKKVGMYAIYKNSKTHHLLRTR